MTFREKPSRDEINSKFTDVQNRIIGATDNRAREQVIREHWAPLQASIRQSNHFGEVDPLDLTKRMKNHLDQLGSTASPNVLPLYHFEQQLRSEIKDKPRDPRRPPGKGLIG